MTYNKQTWQNGDTITADKLNHIETGINEASAGVGNEVLIVKAELSFDDGSYIVDSVSNTYAEILAAENDDKLVIAKCVYATAYGNEYFILPLHNVGAYDQALFYGFGTNASNMARFTVSQNGTNSFEIV